MRILITGASGFIGGHIVQRLLGSSHQIVACVRQAHKARRRWPEIEAISVNFLIDDDPNDWLPRLVGVDMVINCVGIIREQGDQTFSALHTKTPIALFQACEQSGIKRVIQISALGADETAFSEYHLTKKVADDALIALNLEWAILMPSIVYGTGAKSMATFKAMANLPLVPLVDRGNQPIQPIHISDLVDAIETIIESTQPQRIRRVMVGPYVITMKTLYSKIRQWFGYKPATFISLPYALVLTIARYGGFLGQASITPETVQMLHRGNTGDVNDFVKVMDHAPQSMDAILSNNPPLDSDRWHSGLYFLKPLLRLSIAFIWLYTGVISAFVIPTESSYELLIKTGIGLPIMLYGAAAVDMALGCALLLRYQIVIIGWLQIGLILIYTTIITVVLPELWFHPFGPVTKNIPLIIAILTMMVLERHHD